MSSRPLTGRLILVIEDQPLIASDLKDLLEEAGARVMTAGCLPDALQSADAPELAAAVVDFRLGDDHADVVCRRLLARAVPFAFFTGDPIVETEWAKFPVISKPASSDEILATVLRVLEPARTLPS